MINKENFSIENFGNISLEKIEQISNDKFKIYGEISLNYSDISSSYTIKNNLKEINDYISNVLNYLIIFLEKNSAVLNSKEASKLGIIKFNHLKSKIIHIANGIINAIIFPPFIDIEILVNLNLNLKKITYITINSFLGEGENILIEFKNEIASFIKSLIKHNFLIIKNPNLNIDYLLEKFFKITQTNIIHINFNVLIIQENLKFLIQSLAFLPSFKSKLIDFIGENINKL